MCKESHHVHDTCTVYTYAYIDDMYTMCNGKYAEDQTAEPRNTIPHRASSLLCSTKIAFSLPIGLSVGSVIEMKSPALAPDGHAVSLKA